MIRLLTIAMSCLIPCNMTLAAEVSCKKTDKRIDILQNELIACVDANLSGPLIKGDSEKFIKFMELNTFIQSVFISSPGGSVYEALQIGRYVRENLLVTVQAGPCNSACAFIAVSGARRYFTSLGVHRPTLSEGEYEDATQARIAYRHIVRDVELFLKEMDTPSSIIEKMLSTGPNQILQLTNQEMALVNGFPATIQEWLHSRCKGAVSAVYDDCLLAELLDERLEKTGEKSMLVLPPDLMPKNNQRALDRAFKRRDEKRSQRTDPLKP
jgi:ATP-dependent protease ClpP protease subunit